MKRYMQDNQMYVKIMCADFYALRCYAQVDEEGDYLVSHPQRGLGSVDVRRMSREQQQQQYLKQKMEEKRAAEGKVGRATSISLAFGGRRRSATGPGRNPSDSLQQPDAGPRRLSRRDFEARNLSDIQFMLSDQKGGGGYTSSDGESAPLNGGSPKKGSRWGSRSFMRQ